MNTNHTNSEQYETLWQSLKDMNFKYTVTSQEEGIIILSFESLKKSFVAFCQHCQQSQLIDALSEEIEICLSIDNPFNETMKNNLQSELMEDSYIKDLNLFDISLLKLNLSNFLNDLRSQIGNWVNVEKQENQNIQSILDKQKTQENLEQDGSHFSHQRMNSSQLQLQQQSYQNLIQQNYQFDKNQPQFVEIFDQEITNSQTVSQEQEGETQKQYEKENSLSTSGINFPQNQDTLQFVQTLEDDQNFKNEQQGQIQSQLELAYHQYDSTLQNTPFQEPKGSGIAEIDNKKSEQEDQNSIEPVQQENPLSNSNILNTTIQYPTQTCIMHVDTTQSELDGQNKQKQKSQLQFQQDIHIQNHNEQNSLQHNESLDQQNQQITIEQDIGQQDEQQIQNKILQKLEQSNWISDKFIKEFIHKVFKYVKSQDIEKIEKEIKEWCFPKCHELALSYFKQQINQLKEKDSERIIIQLLQGIPEYNTFSDEQISNIFYNLKEKGLNPDIQPNISEQIFQIEKKCPFICKQDSNLLKFYLESAQKLKFTINMNQLNLISQYGFDEILRLNEEFSFSQIESLQINIESSIELQQHLDSLNLLKYRPRLNQIIQFLKNSELNTFNKKFLEYEVEENFIFSFDKFKVFSQEFLQQLLSESNCSKELNVFFSQDNFQNLYVRCLILSELKLKQQKIYFKEIFSFIKLLIDNPEDFIEIWAKKNSKQTDTFLDLLFQQINLFDQENQNGLKLDVIKILMSKEKSKKYLLRTIFENSLISFNIESSYMNELFDQFSNHGLNYFHQIEDINEIKEIERQLKENKLLQFIFGNDFYDETLKPKETYTNFSLIKEQAIKLDIFFKQSNNSKMVIDDFMRYIPEDESQMIIQIQHAVDKLCSQKINDFIKIIFNLLIQFSKRNQDLSSVFKNLSSELRNKNVDNDLINSKTLTEQLFMSVDSEVRQRLTYLLGYSNPIPLIISRLDQNNKSIQQTIMENAFWLLSHGVKTVATVGLGHQRGKSQFINDVFLTNFEISNKSIVFQGSADIQSNMNFKTDKRDYFVIDYHGDCLEVNKNYLFGSYSFYIIQINYTFIKSNKLDKFIQIYNQIDSSFKKMCFVVRDYTESKPNLKEYFDLNIVRQKLGCDFFMDKQVFIIPNLNKQKRDDKDFIIEQSRKYLNELIIESNQTSKICCRDLFAENLLNRNNEEYQIKSHVQTICQQLRMFGSNSNKLFTVYPLFKSYSKYKQKLTRKHFLLNQGRELKQQETNLDRTFYDLNVRYNNLTIDSDCQRSKAAKLFEEIICSSNNQNNTMTYFIKELKLVNQDILQDLILQRNQLLNEIAEKKNKNFGQAKDLELKLQEIDDKIEDKSISVDILWREIIQIYLKHTTYQNNEKILCSYRNLINKGFPFEIIDGDTFYFPKQFLNDIFSCNQFQGKKICVISIIGPQNSGKSTLLNFLLGCDFSVSDQRCTKGIYGTLIQSKVPEFDYILVIDSEGLQSLEKNDSQYDRKIVLFCLSISHLVIINVKDQLTNDMLQLLEVCISARQNIEANTIQKPIIVIVFNQKADPNQNNDQQAIDNTLKSFESNKLLSEIDVSKENVTFLPSAVTSEVVTINGERQFQWRYLKTQVDFVDRVKKLEKNIFDKLSKHFRQNSQLNFKNIVENINQWIDLASILYETICIHPSLTAFKDIKQKQNDSILKDYIKDQIDKYFNQKLYDKIESETSQRNMSESEMYILKICEEQSQEILKGYELVCKTFENDIDDLYERNKNYIIIQIESFKINYQNDLRMTKSVMRVHDTLKQSIYTFDKKLKDLKSNNVNLEVAENEFESLFKKDLDNIKKNIPSSEQTNKEAFQFVSDQYKRYCQYDLIITQDQIISCNFNIQTLEQKQENEIKKLIEDKEIFYSNNSNTQNQEKFIFTNELFLNHIKNLNNSSINTTKIIDYFQTSIQLIDIAFQNTQKLKYFVSHEKYQQRELQNDNDIQMYIDQSKIEEYNQILEVINLKLDPSYIVSQVESNINRLNGKVELIIQGKEQYIQILNLNNIKPLCILQDEFIKKIKNHNDLFHEVKKLIIGLKQNNKNKKKIQYWKSFQQWARIYLQNHTSKQDIININKLVERIKFSLQQQIQNKKVNEELIQSICGYVNDEIKQQEDLIEIFNIKFLKNFKSYIHRLALIALYKQASETRNQFLYKPIQDFENKKSERKQLFIQKFEAKNNINHNSSVNFCQFLKEFSKNFIENKIECHINQIIKQNEKTISRYDLQKQIELNLLNFSNDEAKKYIYQPLELINEINETRLECEYDESIQIQNNFIKHLAGAISDIYEQLGQLNEQIQRFIKEQNQYEKNNQDDDHIFKWIKQIDDVHDNMNTQDRRQSMSIEITNYNQKEIEENKTNVFTNYIFNILIGSQSDIVVNNIKFSVQLDFPYQYQLQKKHQFVIEEFKKSCLFEQIQIDNLTEFYQGLQKNLNDLQTYISKINIIECNKIKEQLSFFNQRIVSCSAKCPCCDQSCDQDHWKFKGIPIGERENKHQSKSGHRLIAFRGIKINKTDQPALIHCYDYEDEDIIIHNNQKMKWKEFKQNSPEWNWNFTNNNFILEKSKWNYLWKQVGRDICKQYGILNYVDEMSYQQIEYFKKQNNMHFLFVFDESLSMRGDKFKGLYQSLVEFINVRINQMSCSLSKDVCTLIGFGYNYKTYAEYEEINHQIMNKIPKDRSGFLTYFQSGLNGVFATLSKKRDYDENIIVIFLSDGKDNLPEKEIKKLNSEYKGKIKQFWTVGYGNENFQILEQMADLLKESCGGQFIKSLNSDELIKQFEQFAYVIPNGFNQFIPNSDELISSSIKQSDQ